MPTLRDLTPIPGLPVIGSLLDYHRDALGLFTQMAAHGDLTTCSLMGQRLTLVNSPALVHSLLVEHGHKVQKSDEFMDAADLLVGHGLVTISEADHKRERGLVASAFTPAATESYADLVNRIADLSQQSFKDNDEIVLGREMMRITLRIIGQILFGVDLEGASARLWNTFTVALEAMHKQMSALIPLPVSVPTPGHLAYRRATADLDEIIFEVIKEHRQNLGQRDDLLARLLKAQSEDDGGFLTDKQIRDELNTMLIAGHETTANALAFTWSHIAHDPEIYARLRKEVTEVLGGRPATPALIKTMPYLNQIWSEALRLYPPVYVTDRQALAPFTLGGYEVAKGDLMVVCPYTLHRRAEVFEDPTRFDPDRFTPEKTASLPKGAYIPFGEGHRVCIGRWLATMEALLMICCWVQHFTFEPTQAHPARAEAVLTLRPDPRFTLRVSRL